MIIYFKDCSGNKDAEGKLYEYFTDSLELDEQGEKDLLQYELPDIFSDLEAERLCEAMISGLTRNGIPMEETLNKEVERVKSLIEELKSRKSFFSNGSEIKSVNISVSLVNRGSFNDERLINSLKIKTEDIEGKPLVWTDVFLNEKAGSQIRIAPVYSENKEMYFLEDKGGRISVVKKLGFSKYYTEDFDAAHIISAEIYCSCNS